MDFSVVIAGGGPTGLMLACELGLAGVDVLVLERRAGRADRSQGMAIHGRTLEALEMRGLRERIRPEDTFVWPRTPFALLWLDLETVGEREYTHAYPQWRTEALLEERALELGVQIRAGHAVTGLEQDDDGVRVTVRSDAGEYQVRCAYAVGCDGARSDVRELAGIKVAVTGVPYTGHLADVVLADDSPAFDAGVLPGGMFGALPIEAGLLRLMTIEFGAEPTEREPMPVTLDDVIAAVRRVTGNTIRVDDVRWMSRFGGRSRCAERYKDRRVLVAGDAAHHYFISGTQGMNAGIHDALNLGWKLAAELGGRAPAGLLDSYDAERRPVGEAMCRHADAVTALIHPLDRVGALRELVGELLSIGEVNRQLLLLPTASDYPPTHPDAHPLVGKQVAGAALATPDGPATVAGLLRDGHGLILDLTDGGRAHIPDPCDRMRVVRAGPQAEFGAEAVIIRPDGHVAYAGSADGDALRAALALWFGPVS